jgi:hypothetical protein
VAGDVTGVVELSAEVVDVVATAPDGDVSFGLSFSLNGP